MMKCAHGGPLLCAHGCYAKGGMAKEMAQEIMKRKKMAKGGEVEYLEADMHGDEPAMHDPIDREGDYLEEHHEGEREAHGGMIDDEEEKKGVLDKIMTHIRMKRTGMK